MSRFHSVVCLVALGFVLVGCYVTWLKIEQLKERRCVENMNVLWNYARTLVFVRWQQDVPTPANMGFPNVEIDVNQLIREFKVVGRCPSGAVYPKFFLYDGPSCPVGHKLPSECIRVWRFTLRGPANKNELMLALADRSVEMRRAAVVLIPSSLQHGIIGEVESRDIVTHILNDPDAGVRLDCMQASKLLRELQRSTGTVFWKSETTPK